MERIALKIQRRRYARQALREISIHRQLRDRAGLCPEIIGLREAFVHDGHICIAFERHGNSLDAALDRGAMALARAQRITRQMLLALDYMHGCGYAHTDVKPRNILYSGRPVEARLGDLGTARDQMPLGKVLGTREYMAPEVIIGAPLTPALDMWSLGCTVFEILTGHLLFNPHTAAAKKYREFSEGRDRTEVPLAESVKKDDAEERAEQLRRAEIVAGKYRLHRQLGKGRYSTVWIAEQLTNVSLDAPDNVLRDLARKIAAHEPPETERQLRDREWQRAKGADDLLDLTLNYEHLLLVAMLCGPFPPSMVQSVRYRASYFEEDGTLRFQPKLRRASLRDRLRRAPSLKARPLDLAADFLDHLLKIDPALRPTAQQALAHLWLAEA